MNSQTAMTQAHIDDQDETFYVQSLIAAATAYAEECMEASLLTRTITATYYSNDDLILPRGPVQEILSVSVNGSPQDAGVYALEGYGRTDVLRYNNGYIQPYAAPATFTVTYKAGYGDTAATIPPDILHAIKAHVALLNENRELANEKTITPVPFLADFYRLKGRGTGVG